MNTSGQEKQSVASSLCANACGFYGSPTTRNLCSKCYRDALHNEQQQESNVHVLQQDMKELPKVKSTSCCITPKNQALQHESTKNSTSLNILTGQISSIVEPISTVPELTDDNYSSNDKSNGDFSTNNISRTTNYSQDETVNYAHVLGNSMSTFTNLHTFNDNAESIPNNLTNYIPNNPTTNPNLQLATFQTNESDSHISQINTDTDSKPAQKNKNRCFKCQKRIGLLGFQCRCSYYFCGAHRHADCHDCSFDYKSFGREQLSKANRRVIAEKLNRI